MNFYKYDKKRKVIVEWWTVGTDPKFYPVSDSLDFKLGDGQLVTEHNDFVFASIDTLNTIVAFPAS